MSPRGGEKNDIVLFCAPDGVAMSSQYSRPFSHALNPSMRCGRRTQNIVRS
jgi:hypothetical protein